MYTNERTASVLQEIAAFLDREHGHPFRIRAYRSAADSLRGWPEDVGDMLARGEPLIAIPGIGADLARHIEEIVRTGATVFADPYGYPVSSRSLGLYRLPGLGRHKIERLRRAGIRTVRELERAAREGSLRALPGFGPRTEENLLQAIERREKRRSAARQS